MTISAQAAMASQADVYEQKRREGLAQVFGESWWLRNPDVRDLEDMARAGTDVERARVRARMEDRILREMDNMIHAALSAGLVVLPAEMAAEGGK